MEIIHIVLGKANPERMNGINKVVYQLASKQVAYYVNASVWGITSHMKNDYGERSFNTRLFLKKNNPFSFSKELKKAIIEKKGKAVFHIHGGWIPVFYSLGKLLNKHNIPFVFTPHGAYNTIAMNRSKWIKKLYFNLFESKLLKQALKIHCIGKSEVNGLKKIYKTRKTVLLPYGYENFKEIIINESINKDIVFGFVGRLDIHTKGLDTLIKAFNRFLKTNSNSQLWIIGDSKEKNKLEKLIQSYSLEKNIILYGSKFGSEKDELIEKMDVFVHPSRNEGLPLSVIEAASFGKPCIVTDATNIGRMISEYQAGITIYSHRSNVLADAMNKMNSTWEKPIEFMNTQKQAIKMVEENYNWGKLITRFNDELYIQ